MDFAKCPKCGQILDYEEELDKCYQDTEHGAALVQKWQGYCFVCEQGYTWFERYIMDKRWDMKEEKEND